MTIASRFLDDPTLCTTSELRFLKHKCEHDFLFFCRLFFYVRESQKLIVNWHHKVIAETLERVANGEITRLIINIPPGYTKTEMAVIFFVAWGIARNPRARSIHISYSDDLAIWNSTLAKDVVQSVHFQALWPRQIRGDVAAKKRWFLEEGGGLMAVSSGGQISGFRGGQMDSEEYSGSVILDDPIKPDDTFSQAVRNRINTRIPNTMRSRLALESTPVIVIMQRLHEEDTTGYLLSGGSGDIWNHLCIPVSDSDAPYDYPSTFTHARPIEYEKPTGPLWPKKHNEEQIELLRQHAYTYASQYAQRPAPLGGGLFKSEWWEWYEKYTYKDNCIHLVTGDNVNIVYKLIFADTAVKTGEKHDWSVVQLWGYGSDSRIYLLDQIRGKWEAPDLRDEFMSFCDRHEFKMGENVLGVRARYVEDKSSGSGLIQDMNRERGFGWVEGIPRDKDKVSRAMSAAPRISDGDVVLPKHAPWIGDYLYEFSMFTAEMSHAHDDQIDPTLDAVQNMLIEGQQIGVAEFLRGLNGTTS
jgi:predicted phage terminase large subunit-like protein